MARSKTKRASLDATKREKLAKMGGRETTVQEFLGLTKADMAAVEARLKRSKLGKGKR